MRDHVGPYRLVEVLGRGGMGVVYRAVHERLDRQVAIKALAAELTREPHFRDRFFSEARTHAQLQHPNIITIYDLLEEDGDYFIVMEFFPGRGLDQVLDERGPRGLGERASLEIFRQVLAALGSAHRAGVVHRDVKPSNVLLDADEQVKLMDFGIALLVGDKRLTQSSQTIGTPVYMSPEQILRPRELDHRTDIYSAGVLLYEMLGGRPPFDADTEYEIKKQHIEIDPRRPAEALEGVSRPVVEAIVRALAKDPAERFASTGEFLAALGLPTEGGARFTAPRPAAATGAAPVAGTAQALAAAPAATPAAPASATAAPAAPPPVRAVPAADAARSPAAARPGGGNRGLIAAVAAAAVVLLGVIVWALVGLGGGSRDAASDESPDPAAASPIASETRSPDSTRLTAAGTGPGPVAPSAGRLDGDRQPDAPDPKPAPVAQQAAATPRPTEAARPVASPGADVEIRRRLVAETRRRIEAGIRQAEADVAAGDHRAAQERVTALLDQAAPYRGELVDEVVALRLLDQRVTDAIVAERTRASEANLRRQAIEARLDEIRRLIEERSYPEAKKLAQSLLGEDGLPAEVAQQARELIERADAELKKVWAGATISEPEHEIEKKERRNRNRNR